MIPASRTRAAAKKKTGPNARAARILPVHKCPHSAADEQVEGDQGHNGAAPFRHKLLGRPDQGGMDQDEPESEARKRQRQPERGMPGCHERPRRRAKETRVKQEPVPQPSASAPRFSCLRRRWPDRRR